MDAHKRVWGRRASKTERSESERAGRGICRRPGNQRWRESDGRQISDAEILVNNLGIFEPKPFEQISDADWFRFFEVNVLSGVRLGRLYLPRMKEHRSGGGFFLSRANPRCKSRRR